MQTADIDYLFILYVLIIHYLSMVDPGGKFLRGKPSKHQRM